MHLPISIIVASVYILSNFIDFTNSRTDEGLELLFTERSSSDWKDVWHRETHSRCREKLVQHLFWACEKDIYKLTRRNDDIRKRTFNNIPWLEKYAAKKFLRTRRNKAAAGSITAECCTKIGCTWEEYAEYCPSNKRRNHYPIY